MTSNEIHLEEDRLGKWTIGLIAMVFLVITAVSIWIAWALLVAEERAISRGVSPPPSITAPTQISGVRQTLINRDQEGIRRREKARKRLERYEWADRERRIVRIPVRRAMELRAKGARP